MLSKNACIHASLPLHTSIVVHDHVNHLLGGQDAGAVVTPADHHHKVADIAAESRRAPLCGSLVVG